MQQVKDPKIAAALGFFLGPFGIIYVSWKQAFIGFGVAFVWLVITAGAGTALVPFGYAVWGYLAAQRFNESHARDAQASAEQQAARSVMSAVPSSVATSPQLTSAQPEAPALSGPATEQSFCTSCGKPLRPGARFCGACGSTQ